MVEWYVTNYGSNSVSVINTSNNKVIENMHVGSGPQGVAYDSGNHMVYVTNAGSNSVSVISITTFIQPPVNKNDNAMIHSSFEGVEAQVAMDTQRLYHNNR